MVKAHFPKVNLMEVIERCLKGKNGEAVEPDDFFEEVMPAAHISEGD